MTLLEKITNLTWFDLINKLKSIFTDVNTNATALTTRVVALEEGGGGSSYKVYSALLTQSGTDAPVPTVLENTIGDIVWTRDEIGTYIATLVNGFIVGQTSAFAESFGQNNNFFDLDRGITEDALTLISVDPTSAPLDENLLNTPIEIRVYN